MNTYEIIQQSTGIKTRIDANWFGDAINQLLKRPASFFTLEKEGSFAVCEDRKTKEIYTIQKIAKTENL